MTAIRRPRTIAAATALCERFAVLDGYIADIEQGRRKIIADVNADCDRATNDLIAQRDAITGKLAPWWDEAADELTQGKRKSIELGGCMIGTREGRTVLEIAGKEDDVAAKLSALRWGKAFVRVKPTIDRAAVLKELGGKRADAFAKMGVSRKDGEAEFYVKRTAQAGTRGGQGNG